MKAKKDTDSEGGSNLPTKLSAAVTEVSMVEELRICIAWGQRHKVFAGRMIMHHDALPTGWLNSRYRYRSCSGSRHSYAYDTPSVRASIVSV